MWTQALAAEELALRILLFSLVLLALQAEKWLARRGLIHREPGGATRPGAATGHGP